MKPITEHPEFKKTKREKVYQKYNGLCAYTGKPLGKDWQVDHITPQYHWKWKQQDTAGNKNDLSNLLPANRIVNHYKRSLDLEGFRRYMCDFHKRLAKLPKNTTVPRTENRIKYLREVAELFSITPDKPFNGKFYFETYGNN